MCVWGGARASCACAICLSANSPLYHSALELGTEELDRQAAHTQPQSTDTTIILYYYNMILLYYYTALLLYNCTTVLHSHKAQIVYQMTTAIDISCIVGWGGSQIRSWSELWTLNGTGG